MTNPSPNPTLTVALALALTLALTLTLTRNALLSAAFAMAHDSMARRGAVAAVFFSGWAGEGRKKHGLWEDGDPIIAEPPPEYQGRNSVYNTDVSTIQIVGSYAQRFEHVIADLVAGVS